MRRSRGRGRAGGTTAARGLEDETSVSISAPPPDRRGERRLEPAAPSTGAAGSRVTWSRILLLTALVRTLLGCGLGGDLLVGLLRHHVFRVGDRRVEPVEVRLEELEVSLRVLGLRGRV